MPERACAAVVIPYRPRPVWTGFHASTARWRVAVAHRRAGKTVALVNEAIRGALSCDKLEPRFGIVGKAKVRGLVNRRAAEVALWSEGEPGSVDEDPPSSLTRAETTPPARLEPRALMASRSFVSTASAGVATAAVAIGEVTQAISPFAQQSALVGRAVAMLALLAAALAAAGVLFVWLKRREGWL